MTARRWWLAFGLVLMALAPSACEGGRYTGTLIFTGEHRFAAETRLPGDVLVRAGTAVFPAGALVEGSVYVAGGTLQLDGAIAGDLVVLDGAVRLGPRSRVGGDLRVGGGTLERAETAVVQGETINSALALPDSGAARPRDAGGWVRGLLGALLWAAAAGGWARTWPWAPRHIARAAARAWPAALALGLLALLVVPILLVMLALTIVLIPLVIVLGGLVLLALALGLAALGQGLAQTLAQRLGWPLSPGWAAFAGTLGLWLLFQVPFLGEALVIGLGLLVFGAVLLTRFGTRDYQPPPRVTSEEDLATYARPGRA